MIERYLSVQIEKLDEKTSIVQILQQRYTGGDFSKDKKNYIMYNNIGLQSIVRVAPASNGMYVRGYRKDEDNKIIKITNGKFEKIKDVIDYYNKYDEIIKTLEE